MLDELFLESAFTRPADTTAYAALDRVGPSPAAVQVFPFSGAMDRRSARLVSATLVKSTVTTTLATFRLWLFKALPTPNPADNAALAMAWADRAALIGYADFPLPTAGTDCAVAFGTLSDDPLPLEAAGQALYGLLQATGGYTPGNAEQFYIRLGLVDN